MQFTPQQLQGGQRYRNTARIGNWKEEIVGEEIESKAFLNKQLNGMNSLKYQTRIRKCNQLVSLIIITRRRRRTTHSLILYFIH